MRLVGSWVCVGGGGVGVCAGEFVASVRCGESSSSREVGCVELCCSALMPAF